MEVFSFRLRAFRGEAATQTPVQGTGGSNLHRDMVFRRSLAVADLISFLLAFFVLEVGFGHSLQLTPLSLVGFLGLFAVAKVIGLYDRDQTLLHKTTLDETPKLFQIATLGALCAWLAGGTGLRRQSRPGAKSWCSGSCSWSFSFSPAPAPGPWRCGRCPPERCFFIGDADSAAVIESKLAGHQGFKAELVGSVDPGDIPTWSTDALSAPRLAEIRELVRSLECSARSSRPTAWSRRRC